MSVQSGVRVSHELRSIFTAALENDRLRLIKAGIEKGMSAPSRDTFAGFLFTVDGLTAPATQRAGRSPCRGTGEGRLGSRYLSPFSKAAPLITEATVTFVPCQLKPIHLRERMDHVGEKDFAAVQSAVTEHTQPCFLFYRESPNSWLFITYIPDNAHIRQKMLYASCKTTVIKDLGGSHFSNMYHCTLFDELSLEAYHEHVKTKNDRKAVMTEAELHRLTAEERAYLPNSHLHMSGTASGKGSGSDLTLGITDEAAGAISRLCAENSDAGAAENVIFLGIKSEKIILESTRECPDIKALVPLLSAAHPAYILYRPRSQPTRLAFIFSSPPGPRVRESMIYAASRSGFLGSLPRQPDTRLEITDAADLPECDADLFEAVTSDLKVGEAGGTNGHRQAGLQRFSRPAGPGGRGRRVLQ